MKSLLFFFLFLLASNALLAQGSSAKKESQELQKMMRKAEKELQLQTDQLPLVQAVYERTFQQRQEIASLKNTQPDQYLRRLQALQRGEAVSLQRILNTEQRTLLQKQLSARRKKAAELARKMSKQGASSQEIALAQAELE